MEGKYYENSNLHQFSNRSPDFRRDSARHIALNNYLSIFVLLAGKLVGQIALANKNSSYSEKDITAIKRLREFCPPYHLERL